ncbi:hypothetical protein [Paenibacillus sedimenti]|uniref:Uncharacterized protein n=1 Tax=Paenibacillus sedimenti TaxID=2770274 RepID=A0A926QIU6_9BACL|nr:hypothetical protein [Paenibacillus sedimenti]MBD0379707.1 hypothetical protein [Paenibacillus sedimenti]
MLAMKLFFILLVKSTVKSIEAFNAEKPRSVFAGNAVRFTLATRFRANLFLLDLITNKGYTLKIGCAKVGVQIEEELRVVDSSSIFGQTKNKVERHEVAELILKYDKEITFDVASEIDLTSHYVLVDQFEISGGGIIIES